MSKSSRTVPDDPRLFRVEVVRSARLTANMQRVTVTGASLGDFPWMGFDHWFRLFVRLPHQDSFALPEISGKRWWKQYLAVDESIRPHCANYTVANCRAAEREMDIDFVVHVGPSGEPEGAAAIWACSTQPGDRLALLDQGILFDLPEDASEVVIVADESGLPAVAGILQSLPEHVVGRVIQEVPSAHDRRDLDAPAGVEVSWVVRETTSAVAGASALEELKRITAVNPHGYGFVVGESTLATEGRRQLHRSGLPKSRITFSGFWKHNARKAVAH